MRGLARAGGDRAVDAARAALDDAEPSVRAAAAVALVRLDASSARVVDVLAEALSNPDWYTRWDACVALGLLGKAASAAVPALLDAATDKQKDLAREAVIALSRIAPKDPQIGADLVRLLQSDRDLDRKALLRAIRDSGHIALATDWLAREMMSDRHGLRRDAARLLAECGVEGTARLSEMLADPDPYLRAGAIYELARSDKVGPAVFLPALKDSAPTIRRAAIDGLTRRKAKETAPRIAELLSDEDPHVRIRAAWAIEGLGAPVPSAAPGLVRLVAEGDKDTAAAALAAMRATGSAALAKFLDCYDAAAPGAEKREWTVQLRPRGGSEENAAALELLLAAIEDKAHGPALVAALQETLASDQDALLVEKLRSDEEAVRRATAVLLGYLGRDRAGAIRALGKAARDESPDVQAAAAQAVERLRKG
jgi:HEAT repeat protein